MMIQGTSIAGRILKRKLAQFVPIAAHADFARPGGNLDLPGLVMESSGIAWQVIHVAGDVLAEDVEAVSDVREEP